MFIKLFSLGLLTAGLAVVGIGTAKDSAAGDCCAKKLACCNQGACCTAEAKRGCCEQGLKCCEQNLACCQHEQTCCTEGRACCEEAKACCGKPQDKQAATPVPPGLPVKASCCHRDAHSVK